MCVSLPPLPRFSLSFWTRGRDCFEILTLSLHFLAVLQNEYDKCYDDWERSCLKSSINPRGIPIHHLFASQFFGRGAASPFAPWALVPGMSFTSLRWIERGRDESGSKDDASWSSPWPSCLADLSDASFSALFHSEDIRQQNNTYIGYSIEEECVKQPVRVVFRPSPCSATLV